MLKNLKVSLFLAYKSIRGGDKGTLILTVMIMSLIFINLAFLSSIVSGIGERMNLNMIDYTYSNLVIEPKEDNLYIDDVDSIQKKINSIPDVVGTSPRYMTGATFSYKNKFLSRMLYSINPIDEEAVTKIHTGIIDGEFLSTADTDEIVLGIYIAGEEGKEEEFGETLGGVKVGDKIDVTFSNGVIKEYRVKGIIKTKAWAADDSAFITEKEMESVLGLNNKASQILVKVSQRGTENEFKKTFMELGVSEDIKTWQDKSAGFIRDITRSFDLVKIISTGVSLIIAVIVIFIVIYINTVHKRKQIGILKAIGIDQRVIINSYVIQALFYCLCGIIIGLFLLYFLTSYLISNPIEFPMGDVRPLVEQQLIVTSIVSLVIVSLVAGFIPSWKTARENILKAIWG